MELPQVEKNRVQFVGSIGNDNAISFSCALWFEKAFE